MKLWKYSGTLLTATGIIHTIYALFLGKEAFTEMLNNGLIDSIGENHNLGFAFWFLICGIILILWGETLQYLSLIHIQMCIRDRLIGSLSILGSTRAYCQQSRTISGIVKNSQGETIIGANIVEKGTSNGTITNVDGLFRCV